MLECCKCHKQKPDVSERRNPYVWEICDEERIEPLCDSCYEELCDDI